MKPDTEKLLMGAFLIVLVYLWLLLSRIKTMEIHSKLTLKTFQNVH